MPSLRALSCTKHFFKDITAFVGKLFSLSKLYFLYLCKQCHKCLMLYKPVWKVKVSVAQSCLSLCDTMDCTPPTSPVRGISQERILEWVAIPFSRRLSQPRDQIQVFCIAGRFLTNWAKEPNSKLRMNSWMNKWRKQHDMCKRSRRYLLDKSGKCTEKQLFAKGHPETSRKELK